MFVKVQTWFSAIRSSMVFAVIVSPKGFQTGSKSGIKLMIFGVVFRLRVGGFGLHENSEHYKYHHVGFSKFIHHRFTKNDSQGYEFVVTRRTDFKVRMTIPGIP